MRIFYLVFDPNICTEVIQGLEAEGIFLMNRFTMLQPGIYLSSDENFELSEAALLRDLEGRMPMCSRKFVGLQSSIEQLGWHRGFNYITCELDLCSRENAEDAAKHITEIAKGFSRDQEKSLVSFKVGEMAAVNVVGRW